MPVFTFESLISEVVTLVMLVATLWGFVDALTRRADAFTAASKLTKPAWSLMLGLSAVVDLVFHTFSLLGFVAAVIVLVYFLDVRPALAALTRRR